MTEPKVLADALVEAGIVSDVSGIIAEKLITDWRVAGKVLESIDASVTRSGSAFACATGGEWIVADSLPRAIIEAWYEARETE